MTIYLTNSKNGIGEYFSKKVNILYHHRTQGHGVEKVHILGIVNSWISQGHNVDIISPPGVSLDSENSSEESVSNGVIKKRGIFKNLSRHMPELIFEFMEIIYNIWAYFKISDTIKRKKYDMLFERYAFLCAAGYINAKIHNIPYLIEVNYTSATPIVRNRNIIIKKFERLVEKKILSGAIGIIVVSTFLRNELVKSGIDDDKIIVLPNAADPDLFNPNIDAAEIKSNYELEGKNIIGFVGYFYAWHGVEFFVKTYKCVRKHFENFVYILIGDGPEYENIERIVQNEKLEKYILLIGRVPHEEINQYISLFDIAVMPHSNVYGSPMKILEYMAMGKVVVAPRLSPIEDIIEDGYDGILFEKSKTKDFKKKILELLKNSEKRRIIGSRARQKIEKELNWKTNATKILELYLKKRNHK